MGFGKTSASIRMMNNDTENNYIYITPFLKEVERIKTQCTNRKFYEPQNIGKGKLDSLHYLLKEGKNIASTHALFQMSTEVTRELIKANNYILILDEVCDVIEQLPLKPNDLEAIFEHAHIEGDVLIWDNMLYDGRYNDIMTMALNKSLVMVNDTLLMWNFPVNIFTSFKDCYVMTYMFQCQIQKYYYDIHGIECEYFSVIKDENQYKIIPYANRKPIDKTNLRDKIKIYEGNLNNIGDADYSLSASWYNKQKNKHLVETLKKNIYNYFHNKADAKGNQIIWTTFKLHKSRISGKGYTKSFLSCNARATNEFRDRNCLAYCLNIFLNPIIKQFFDDRGVKVLEDDFALSELLQWIWRSAIRDGQEIYIYIPSARMRNLIHQWLKTED